MFKTDDDTIGIREFTCIILIGFCSKVTDSTPTLYFKNAKNAGWLSPILSALLTTLLFLLIYKLLKTYKDKGLIQIIIDVFGRFFGNLLILLLFISMLIFTVTNTRSYSNITSTLFFPKTNVLLINAGFIFTSAYIAGRGLKAIGRTAWILLPFIEVSLIVLALLSFKNSRTEFLYPLAGGGIKSLVSSGIKNTSVFSEIITFAIFFPMIKNHKTFKRSSILGLWLSLIHMVVFYACYIMIFDYPAVVIINYPFHTLSRLIHATRFFTNLEAIFLLFWIIISLIRFSMYLYTLTGLFAYTFKIEKIEPLVLPLSALCFLLGMLPENNIITVQVIRNINLQLTSVLYFVFPLLLYFASKIKGGLKDES